MFSFIFIFIAVTLILSHQSVAEINNQATTYKFHCNSSTILADLTINVNHVKIQEICKLLTPQNQIDNLIFTDVVGCLETLPSYRPFVTYVHEG